MRLRVASGRRSGSLSMARRNADKPLVLLVAHEIHDRGGMERSLAELIRRASEQVSFHVMSVELQKDLRGLVSWSELALPRRPLPVLLPSFWAATTALGRRVGADLVLTAG